MDGYFSILQACSTSCINHDLFLMIYYGLDTFKPHFDSCGFIKLLKLTFHRFLRSQSLSGKKGMILDKRILGLKNSVKIK